MSSVDISLRITGQSSQGGRKYMEDAFVVAYQHTDDGKDLEYAFFGIFDGHGGKEAAQYAKTHLLDNIVSFKSFWQDDDELVLKSIRDGFVTTHLAMWREVETWPKTFSGLPSTAGTTASVIFIRKGKLYTGHVGDSRIVIGYKDQDSATWKPECLTQDHKPETPEEKKRIYDSGGLVMNKSGVERVVWKRPRTGHQGPIRRSTDFDKIPFLAVARSLGDLWSYDYLHEEYVVSPEPDVGVISLDLKKDHCIVLASDGLWNMMTPSDAVLLVQEVENENRKLVAKFGLSENTHLTLCNPSKVLVDCALERWNQMRMRADNTSVVTVMLDLAGPCGIEVLREQLTLKMTCPSDLDNADSANCSRSFYSFSKRSSDSRDFYKSETDENAVENRLGYLNLASKLFDGEKATEASSNRCDNERHSNSPLQSCSNFLPEHTTPSPKHTNKKTDVEGIENSPCPFPRWSKSASGRTSLSKLATWSKVVSHRRMSDPFPHTDLDDGLALAAVEYDLTPSEDYEANEEEIASLSDDDNDCETYRCEDFKRYNLRSSPESDNLVKTTLDHFYGIKQAIKRKYPGTEVSQPFVNDSVDKKNNTALSVKRKPNLLNLSTLKAMSEIHDIRRQVIDVQ